MYITYVKGFGKNLEDMASRDHIAIYDYQVIVKTRWARRKKKLVKISRNFIVSLCISIWNLKDGKNAFDHLLCGLVDYCGISSLLWFTLSTLAASVLFCFEFSNYRIYSQGQYSWVSSCQEFSGPNLVRCKYALQKIDFVSSFECSYLEICMDI